MMRCLLLTLILLSIGCQTTDRAESEPSVSIAGEQLLATPPTGWSRVFQMNNERSRISDFVPPGESDDAWTIRLTFESSRNDNFIPSPEELLDAEFANDQSRCSFVDEHSVFSGDENNYPTAVRLFFCGDTAASEGERKGEVKLIKAIQGKEHIYFIRIVSRTAAFTKGNSQFGSELIAEWSSYLRKIKLCDGTDVHPCRNES